MCVKKDNKKRVSLLVKKAREMAIKSKEKQREYSEKEAFLYTSKINASKMFEKYL